MKYTNTILLFSALMLFTQIICSGQYWDSAGEMPYPVAGGEAIVIGSKIYILGGYSDDLQASTSMIQQFDPYNGTWEVIGSMNAPRVGLSTALYNDVLYFFGGINDSSSFINSFERFNTLDNSLGNVDYENNAFNREYAASVVVGSKLYIFGGIPNQLYDSLKLPHLSIYDFDSTKIVKEIDTLFQTAESPSRQMAVAIDNDIYIFGGVSNTISNKIYKYDTEADTISRLGYDMQVPRAGGAAVYVHDEYNRDVIYLVGGSLESESAINTVEVFELSEGMFSSRYETTFATPRTDLMAVDFNGEIYLFGGYDASGNVVADVEILFTEPTTSSLDNSTPPQEFELHQNFPNPFNPDTQIRFDVARAGNYNLVIYSALGEKITTLTDQFYTPGAYKFNWNGESDLNIPVPSGVYFYRLSTAGKSIVKKMTLLR